MDNTAVIEQIRSGNKDAIKAVYQENAKDIYSFAKSITGDHDSAMDVTKKTFVSLFTDIQNGSEPQDIRLAALKIAYNEACQAAMPEKAPEVQDVPEVTDDGTVSPDETDTPAAAHFSEEQKTEEDGVVGDGIIDTKEELEAVFHESNDESDADSWKDEPDETEAPEDDQKIPETDDQGDEDELGNTQVFELVIDENEEDEEVKGLVDDESDDHDEYEYVERKPRRKGVTALIVIINIILILILLWLIVGLLVSFGVLPEISGLGYGWFNNHIYPLF